MLKRMTLLTIAAALALTLMAPTGQADAAQTDAVNVTVRIMGTVSVDVFEGTYDFSDLFVGATVISSTSLTVTNDGTGIDETYSLNCTNTADWTAGSVAGPNVFVLRAQFNSGMPASFDATDDVLTTSAVAASATQFAGADQTGVSVPYLAVRNLWLEIQTPTTSSASVVQTIQLTVTAEAS